MSRIPQSLNYVNTFTNTALYHKYFPGDLYYLHDPDTDVYFLADTGSAVNVIRLTELKENYPEAYANRVPIKQPLQGIGGRIHVTALTYLPFAKGESALGKMPFCTRPEVPLNVIGNEWLSECDDEALRCKRLHPSDVPVLAHTEEPWDLVSLITSLSKTKPGYELAPNVPEGDRQGLLEKLYEAQRCAKEARPEDLPEVDLNFSENTVIPEKQWREVYQPYSADFENLKRNLQAPSKLSLTCKVKLRDPTVEPHVARQYSLPPEQKNALDTNIANLIDLGIIEEGDSDWKCSLFVVPQKVNDAQRAEKGWVQTWHVVHDQKPLNVHVLMEEDTLPRIPEIFAIATGKLVFSLVDLKKAFFHCDVHPDSQIFFGIPHPEKLLRMRKMPMGFKNSLAIWQRIMNHDVLEPVHKRYAQLANIIKAEADASIVAYIDDIFLATRTVKQHLILLDVLFHTLSQLHITVNINKSKITSKRFLVNFDSFQRPSPTFSFVVVLPICSFLSRF